MIVNTIVLASNTVIHAGTSTYHYTSLLPGNSIINRLRHKCTMN